MLKSNKIQTLVINNPFDRSDVTTVELEAEGKSLTTLFADVESECVVALNGRIVDENQWDSVIPISGDSLAISVVPSGGEGGAKDVLRIAAVVALAYFTFGAGTIFTAGTFGSTGMAYAAASAAFIGGSMLINKILPPTMPELPDQSLAASPSQTYGIDGPKNTSREGIPVPLCFGGYNMAANYINTRTINQGQQQRLFLLVNAGEGEIKGIKDVRINGELAESFDATVVTRNGTSDQEVIEDFTDASFDSSVTQVLEDAGDDMTFTTSTPSSSIEVDIVFQQGLYKLNAKTGAYATSVVNIIAGFRKRGSNTNIWHSLKEESYPCIRVEVMNRHRSVSQGAELFRIDKISFIDGVDQDLDRFESFVAPLDRVVDERDEYGGRDDYFEIYKVIGINADGSEEELGEYSNQDSVHNKAETGTRFYDNTPSAVRYTLRSPSIELDNYEIFIERLTEKPDNENPDRAFTTANAMTVSSFRQYRGVEGIAYNHTALIGVSVTVDNQINSMPTITYYNEGMLIPVYRRDPENPSQFIYTMEASSNPAWIVHAMYTNKRWGAAKPASALVMEEFYEWAQLCDENGWHFRGVFDSQMNIFDAAKAVAKIGHARIIPIGTQYGVNVQHKQQMTQVFTSALMVKDSFEISWLPTSDRANVIDCTFYDATNFNKPRTFRYYNESIIEKGHPFRPAELTLFGVDNMEQAVAECEFALNYNQLAQTVTFEAPVSAIACRVGQVIGVQHDLPAWGTGGLLKPNSTRRVIQLDRPVTMEDGKNYAVLVHFNSKQYNSINASRHTNDAYTLVSTQQPAEEANRIVVSGQDLAIENVIHDTDNSRYLIIVNEPLMFFESQSVELYRTDAVETRQVETVAGQSTTLVLKSTESDFSGDPQPLMQFSFGETFKQVKKLIVTDISGSGVETRTIAGLEYYEEVFDRGLVQQLPDFSSFVQQVREVEDLIVSDQVIGNSSDKDLVLTASWRYNDENLVQKANVYFAGKEGEPLELIQKSVGNVVQIPYQEDFDLWVRIAVVPLDAQGVELNAYRREITHLVTTFLEIPAPKNIVGTLVRDEITLYWDKGNSQYFGDAVFRYDVYRSFMPKGQVAQFPNDYHLYDTTMEKFARVQQLQEDKDIYFAIVAVNPFRTSQKSTESVYSITTPAVFSNRTSNSGIEIWYSDGVNEGETLGNPDTHPQNWSMEFSSTAVVQAVLTWSNFSFQPWAVTNLASDSVGMNYLGAFATYPSSPNEGDMILLTTNNSYYVRRGGAWELFLDRNVSGLSAQYSPNGVQDSADPAYNWSSSFRAGTDRFMRQSTDSGTTWSQSILIVGEKGDGGRYRDYRFTRSIDAPALDKSQLEPTGWFEAPPTGENPVWFIVVEKNPDGSFYAEQWGDPIRLTGIDGKPGDNAVFYKIGYPNGTAIKNGNNTVSLNIRRINGSVDEVITSGENEPQLFDGATNIGFAKTFAAVDINGSKVIKLKYNNVVLDSITLVDVTDGEDGVYGSISHNNTLSWVRAKNKGSWSPTNKVTDLTVTFYKAGSVIATRVVTAQLDSSTGKVSITGKSTSGETTTLSIANNNTSTPDFTVTHTASGSSASESIHAIEGGEKGDTPDVIQNPDGSVTIIGNNGSANVNKGQDVHSLALENDNLALKLDELGDPSTYPSNSVKIYYGSVDDTANWEITAESVGCTGTLTNGVYQLTSITNKIFAYVIFAATRNGFPTLTKRWNLTTVETVTQIFDPAQIVVTEGHDWVFGDGTLGSFTAGGMLATSGTGTVKLKANTTNPYLLSPRIDVAGSDHHAIVVRLRCISASLKSVFQVYYQTSGHNVTNDFKLERNVVYKQNEWVTLTFDMRHLTHGDSNDYLNSVIQHFRMDFDSGANVHGQDFELDYVAIGTLGAADKTNYKDGRVANDKLTVENIKNGASWTILPENGSTKGATWNGNISGKPSDSVLKTDAFKETFDTLTSAQFEKEFETSSGDGEISFPVDDAVSGGRFLRVGNNSGNDQRWSVSNERFAYDPSKTYILRFRARKVAGSGKAYFGIVGEDKNGNLCNINGDNTHSSQHYFAASSYTLSTEWEEFTAYISGHGATKAEGGAGSTFLNPAKPHPNVRYIRPMFIVNYSLATGITDIDSITLTEVLANPKAASLETVTDGVEGRLKLKIDGVVEEIDVFSPSERTKLDRLRQGKMPLDASKLLIDTAAAQAMANTAEANAKKIKASPNLLSISDPAIAFYNGYSKKNLASVSTTRGYDTWRYENGPMLELVRPVSTDSGEQDNFYYKNVIAVESGERYCFQIKVATHRVSLGLYIKINYKDGTHSYSSSGFSASHTQAFSDGKHKDRYHLISHFVDIPANAISIHPMILMSNSTQTSSSSYIFAIEWALNKVAAGSTEIPDYNQPSPLEIQDLGFTGAKDANKVEFLTDGTLGRIKYKINGIQYTYEAVSQAQIDARADSVVTSLRPDSAYKNDKLTQANIRSGAGWSTLPADGANKTEVDGGGDEGQMRVRTNGGSWTNVDVFSATQRTQLLRLREGKMPNDPSKYISDTVDAQNRVNQAKNELIEDTKLYQGGGGIIPDPSFNDLIRSGTSKVTQYFNVHGGNGNDRGYAYVENGNLILRRSNGNTAHDVFELAFKGSNLYIPVQYGEKIGCRLDIEGLNGAQSLYVQVVPRDINYAGTSGYHHIITSAQTNALGSARGVVEGTAVVTDERTRFYTIRVNIPNAPNYAYYRLHSLQLFRLPSDVDNNKITQSQIKSGAGWSNLPADGANKVEFVPDGNIGRVSYKINGTQYSYEAVSQSQIDGRVASVRPDNQYKNTNTTKEDVGLGNVPNWSSTAFRSEAVAAAKNDSDLHNTTGDGINRFPAIYNNPDSEVPIHSITRATVTYTTWDGNGFAGKSAFYMTATGNDSYFLFGKDYNDLNIRLNRGRRWIVSAWVKVNSNHSGKNGQFYFYFKNSAGAGKYNGANVALPNAYQTKRVSAVIDMTSTTDDRNSARNVQLRFDNEGGNGCIVIIDKIMIEEDVGGKGLPSPYIPSAEPSLVTAKDALPMTSTVSASAAVYPENPLYIGLFNTGEINIRAHTLYTPSGAVSYNAGSISGLKNETRYYIYCRDPYFRGGSRTYYAVEVSSVASVTNEPGHRYIGSITTPKSGGGAPTQGAQEAGYPKHNTI